MGSYSQVTFADYPIFENKNWYYEEVVKAIFQPDDFICEKRKCALRNKLVWGEAYAGNKGFFEFKGFYQTVKVCKQRLEIYGTSCKSAKLNFAQAKKIAKYEGFYSFSLSSLTYDDYLVEIKSIIGAKEKSYDQLFSNLRESLIAGDLGIHGQSIEYLLYSILSVLPEDEIVEYDLTEVIAGGWVDTSYAKNIDYQKIIVLTEGKTDVEFISKSIEKFYPYLSSYYHFIDFDEYKVESNASALVKMIISFAAAKVKHPIIALFDNDTTGIMEMKSLVSKVLPSNIKVLKYPDISLAKRYPTKGPTGNKVMNVNGLACGIEMYFGKEVLTKNKLLIPIQWKGFNEKEKKYQGEISDKQFVQEEFRNKLKSELVDEFAEMNQLLSTVFSAYQ